jgi:hypothetical protein
LAVARQQPKGAPEILQELFDLLKAYAKQETLDPLKALGRYLAWGAAGALLLSIGIFFLALAGLRALQSQMTTFRSTWSWAPYLMVAVVLIGVIAVAAWRIKNAYTEHEGAR